MKKSSRDYEKELEAAGEKMGALMEKSPEKERLRLAKKEVEAYASEMEKKGSYIDRSSIFAAWIIADPDLHSHELKEAAREYIDIDYNLIKAYKSEDSRE